MPSSPSEVVTNYKNICNSSQKPDDKAAALAKLYTPSAVAVFPEGIFTTNSEIQADLSAQFQAGWSNIQLVDQGDNIQDTVAWSYGNYSGNLPGQAVKGY